MNVAGKLMVMAITMIPAMRLAAQSGPTSSDWQKAAGGKMSFEVVSIRLGKPDEFISPTFPLSSDDSYRPNAGLFTADFSLRTYIEFAYKLWLTEEQENSMLEHLPKWVGNDSFVIHARAAGNPTKDQMRLMMQSLLADRFGFVVHFEKQDVPVLAMTLLKPGKMGPKLTRHDDGPPCSVVAVPYDQRKGTKGEDIFPPACDSYSAESRPNHMVIVGSRNTTMALIAASLPSLGRIGKPIVDRTGLNGRFDFTIEWRPESSAAAPGAEEPQATTFEEALKEQLGVKLTAIKAPLTVPVIDHVERPSEN